jgi:hypothetical protein
MTSIRERITNTTTPKPFLIFSSFAFSGIRIRSGNLLQYVQDIRIDFWHNLCLRYTNTPRFILPSFDIFLVNEHFCGFPVCADQRIDEWSYYTSGKYTIVFGLGIMHLQYKLASVSLFQPTEFITHANKRRGNIAFV